MSGDAVRTLLRGVGQVLITAGVVLLLFAVYELKVTNLYTNQQQDQLGHALEQQWESPAPRPTAAAPDLPLAGKAFGKIYIPAVKLGKVLLEGVGKEDLKKGPGHYPGTALPGQLGNVVVSGHRTTYGAPFNRLDELEAGDAVVIETRTAWFTYRVQYVFVVKPTAVEVTYPVPGKPGAIPSQRLLTLTTCHPKYSAKQRLIVQAVLESTLVKTSPSVRPPALRGR